MRDHGVRSIEELLRQGLGRTQINSCLETGELRRIHHGWYASPFADEQVVRGIRVGGRVGCLSGCKLYGLWVPHHWQLHVCYGEGRRPKSTPGVCLHPFGGPVPAGAVWSLEDCLQQVAHRHDMETGLIVLESALNLGLARPSTVRDVIASLPSTRRRMAGFLSPAESGSETRVRLFLQRRRYTVRPQVSIPQIGRVDLLVGNRVILECDSDEHHRSKEQHNEDRRRDLAALALGLRPIRLTYRQIWHDWEATQAVLLSELRRRRHISR